MTTISDKLLLLKAIICTLLFLLLGCASNPKPLILNDNKATSNKHSDFVDAYSLAFKETFFLLGDKTTDVTKFKSATFYVATSDKVAELESIFRDYAKRIGSEHAAFFLKYGSQDYVKRIDELKCFHIAAFEVPAIIYVDLKKEKCYYFSHADGKLLTDALISLDSSIKNKSNIEHTKIKFDLEATVEDLINAFPQLKPIRDLILRIAQHILLNDR